MPGFPSSRRGVPRRSANWFSAMAAAHRQSLSQNQQNPGHQSISPNPSEQGQSQPGHQTQSQQAQGETANETQQRQNHGGKSQQQNQSQGQTASQGQQSEGQTASQSQSHQSQNQSRQTAGVQPDPVPWQDPVDGVVLFNELTAALARYLALSEGASE